MVVRSRPTPRYFSMRDKLYPYLMVSIRSGVAFLKVTGPRTFEKIDGTSIGASTYLVHPMLTLRD
jgi:type II pantothenate kinase